MKRSRRDLQKFTQSRKGQRQQQYQFLRIINPPLPLASLRGAFPFQTFTLWIET